MNLLVEKRDRRTIALTSVQGMGGIGKTVLVQALCEDPRVKAAFPDGIFWQSIGKESAYKMADRLRAVCLALNGNCEFSRSEADHYQLLMRDKRALLIVDDVWSAGDIQPWLATAPGSRVLFTTRNQEIAAGVGAKEYEVELLNEAQSRQVFAQWAGAEVDGLPAVAEPIIRECKGLALAISMVGAMLRGKPAAVWERTLKLLRNADLEKIKVALPQYPHPSLFAAMEVSINSLEAVDRERYYALAVLLEEMAVSGAIQQALWGTNEDESAEAAERLMALSLAQRDGDGTSIRLHDLQLDFVRAQFPDKQALNLIHSAVRLSSHVIAKDPRQFASQLVGRLMTQAQAQEGGVEIGRFLSSLKRGSPRPWLMPRTPVLDSPGGALIRTLASHTGWVNRVAMSGDGNLLVSASWDKTLKVWEVESGRELRTLAGHKDGVIGVAISADGKLVVSASADQTLRVWEVESGREVATFTCEGAALCGVFGKANQVIAGDAGGRVYFLEMIQEGKEFREPQTGEERLREKQSKFNRSVRWRRQSRSMYSSLIVVTTKLGFRGCETN